MPRRPRSGALQLGVVTGLAAMSVAGACLIGCHSRVKRPNVLFIVVDTLRADHLPDYGYARDTIGAMADFTRRATRFERCYAPSSWTLPSTASIVTGLLPARHGVLRGREEQSDRIPSSLPTLPVLLHEAGWSTAGISLNPYVAHATGFARGYDTFLDVKGDPRGYPDVSKLVESGRQLMERAPRPFFLYFQPMNTHGPYRVPEPKRAVLLGHPPSAAFQYADLSEGPLRMRARVLAHPEIKQSLIDQYDTAVRYSMDTLDGLLDELKKEGLYDDTLIVLTADHGEELFDHGGFAHGYSLYNELLHVPLYIKLPRQREARSVKAPVSLVDLMPTILELSGQPVPEHLDGLDLAKAVKTGKAPRLERDFPLEILGSGEHPRCDARGLLRWPLKLIRTRADYQGKHDAVELFDLQSDPKETLNLARQRADEAARMEAALGRELAAAAKGAPAQQENPPAKLDRKTLEALGYL